MTTTPKLTRPTYYVWVAPDGTTPAQLDSVDTDALVPLRVIVSTGDQLRAELEAKRANLGNPKESGMHISLLWIWAAMVRTGRTTAKWQEFKDLVLGYTPEDTEAPEGATVDPTAASTS